MRYLKIVWCFIISLIIMPLTNVHALSLGGVDVEVVTNGDGLYADSYETGRYIYWI